MSNPLDILLVGNAPGCYGGIDHYMREQRNQLEDHLDIDIFNTYVNDPVDRNIAGFFVAIVGSIIKFFKFMKHPQKDIIHIHTAKGLSFYRFSFYILYAAKVRNTPVILHTQGSQFDEFISTDSIIEKWYFNIVLDSCVHIIVLTELQKKGITEFISNEKVSIFNQPVKMDGYDPEFEGPVNHIVFLASFTERKGLPEFVSAIEDVLSKNNFTNLKISIVGEGPLDDLVVELEKNHEEVHALGYTVGNEKIDIWNKADIYVLPTHGEGFPIAIIEAMAGGNAIITSDVSGIPEVIGPENGIIVSPGNVTELKNAIIQLLEDPEFVRRSGRMNYQIAKENHRWVIITDQLINLYENIKSNNI